MNNLKMFCITLEPSHFDFIKKLNYIPVGLGQKKFSNDWLTDRTGKKNGPIIAIAIKEKTIKIPKRAL